ncbi:unnamed protein product [Mytilus coruscus]|uniref:CCHC-type domain-containing protein n=1 Tax=Mytilus coruscus TaxID=42192 RepID=A0A6J8A1Y5_MYTCO|nr:unnamed protein product [Mytilus coruscus]
MTDHRSEDEDELLLHESTTPLVLSREVAFPSLHVPVSSTATQQTAPQQQISDSTFQLFTSYFDSKISALKNENLISGLVLKLNKRNKLIRIADKSPACWTTVREYEREEIASDSDDEKRLSQAESRALKTIKEKKSRTKPCYECHLFGHWNSNCPNRSSKQYTPRK